MEIKGAYKIAASREKVWAALNDPAILKKCIPGCEKLDKESDTAFSATVKTKIGPVSAKFAGAVTLEDLDPPNGYRIVGEGKGGVAGFAKGGAKVVLREEGGATVLAYDAEAKVGGKLAQIGSRLVLGTVRKLTDDFFKKFAETVAPGTAAEKVAVEAEGAA
ncbi:MAG: SRPBCC family protein [Alphaproteobacteria bacterium]